MFVYSIAQCINFHLFTSNYKIKIRMWYKYTHVIKSKIHVAMFVNSNFIIYSDLALKNLSLLASVAFQTLDNKHRFNKI